MFVILVPVTVMILTVVPFALAFLPFVFAQTALEKLGALVLAPLIFSITYLTVGAMIARIGIPAMIRGKFPRDLKHIVYGPRRLYGLCWTSIYYFTPLYWAVLSIPTLKKAVFRMFGYPGTTDFVIYPDTWIRDLPLLKISKGAYLANKSTVGTNMCLVDGSVLVDHVSFGEKATLGHMAMIAPGASFGANCESGVNSGVGIRAKIGDGTKIGVYNVVNHGARVGEKCNLGPGVYVGMKTVIGNGLVLPPYFLAHDGATYDTQESINSNVKQETSGLKAELRSELLKTASGHGSSNIIGIKE